MMTPQDRKLILDWKDPNRDDLKITLIKTEDRRTGELKGFLDTLSELLPFISVKTEKSDDGGMPVIRIRQNILYQAIPEGPELSLFLKTLSTISGKASPDAFSRNIDPDDLPVPARLKVFIAPHCPYCPAQVESLLSLACHADSIHLEVIDGVMFQEVSEKYRVQSAPTVILDDTVTWTGRTSFHEILSMIRDRDPSGMGPETLEGMLKNGEAFKLAKMMLEKKRIFPALIAVMEKGKWPVRLGAMVVFETIADEDIGLAGEAVKLLFDRLPEMTDEKAKGDIIYIGGVCGDESLLPVLEEMALKDPLDDELRDAIQEAISAIRERG